MREALLIATIFVGTLIIILTLFQGKGGGLGSAWGGAGSFQTRRGLEKWMMRGTAVLIVVFFVISVINLIS